MGHISIWKIGEVYHNYFTNKKGYFKEILNSAALFFAIYFYILT